MKHTKKTFLSLNGMKLDAYTVRPHERPDEGHDPACKCRVCRRLRAKAMAEPETYVALCQNIESQLTESPNTINGTRRTR